MARRFDRTWLAWILLAALPAAAQQPADGSPSAAPPDPREAQRQQLLNAFSGSRAAGQCVAVRDLQAWQQQSNWADGKALLDRFFVDVVLGYWVPESERKRPDAAQVFMPKFVETCTNVQSQYQQLIGELTPAAGAAPLPADAAAARKELADAFSDAREFGECGTYEQWLLWLSSNVPAERKRALGFLESGYFTRMGYDKYKEAETKFHNECELAGVRFQARVEKLQTQP